MIIADTGFWVAFLDRRDRFHLDVCGFVRGVKEGLITTLPVVTETCYLLQRRVGQDKAKAFVERQALGGYAVFSLDEYHFPRIAALMGQYADLPMDFADASLVVLAEHLGHGRIVSTDQRDFNAYRWKNRYPFTNLLDGILSGRDKS